MPFSKYKKIFITATDTGVGKSIFTSILASYYLSLGNEVTISKPIQTGEEKDTDLLADLTGNKISIFNTYTFKLPAAPSVAASFERKEIHKEKIIADVRKLEKEFDVVLVEGIGGIAVPLSGSYLISDLIKDLNYPLIVVCRPTLGTINHAVLTLEYAKQKGLNIIGYVISGYDEKTTDPVIKTAEDEITNVTGVKCLMKVPYIENPEFKNLNSLLSPNLV